MQRQLRRGRRRLHEQGLGQLALVLLDLLLQVSDCARNLAADTRPSAAGNAARPSPVALHRRYARDATGWANPLPSPGDPETFKRTGLVREQSTIQ